MRIPAPSGSVGLLLALLSAVPAAAQRPDAGQLVVKSRGREIGGERFRIAADSTGVRYTARTVYPGRPPLELNATLERGTQGTLAFQLDRRGAAGGQVYAVQQRGRLTVRQVNRGREQASELPGDPELLLLADSVFVLYAQLIPHAGEQARSLTAVFPTTRRRIVFTVQRAGGAQGSIIRLGGGLSGEIQLGNHDELLRISLPALGLEAVRKPE